MKLGVTLSSWSYRADEGGCPRCRPCLDEAWVECLLQARDEAGIMRPVLAEYCVILPDCSSVTCCRMQSHTQWLSHFLPSLVEQSGYSHTYILHAC